jgi:hypothetical protein
MPLVSHSYNMAHGSRPTPHTHTHTQVNVLWWMRTHLKFGHLLGLDHAVVVVALTMTKSTSAPPPPVARRGREEEGGPMQYPGSALR